LLPVQWVLLPSHDQRSPVDGTCYWFGPSIAHHKRLGQRGHFGIGLGGRARYVPHMYPGLGSSPPDALVRVRGHRAGVGGPGVGSSYWGRAGANSEGEASAARCSSVANAYLVEGALPQMARPHRRRDEVHNFHGGDRGPLTQLSRDVLARTPPRP
jgi:hypothetical protein